ncbi:MAG: hypothetical protein MJ106_08135 [Lentisphaeria bacterium]|nr:hypothetical protein [Lentisphaeria bacterium]
MTRISGCVLLCILALAGVSCRSLKTTNAEVKPAIPLPEFADEELQAYLSKLALDEIFVERMVMKEPPAGELLPSSRKFGVRNDTSELPQAHGKVLADLAEASSDSGMKQVAAALLQQELILQIIYMASYPMKLQAIDDKHGLVLANAGVTLREFRERHSELPGVLAERVLEELSPWLDIFPEWTVLFSLDVVTMKTDSPESPQEGQPTLYGNFVRNPDMNTDDSENAAEERRWFHWMFGGKTGFMKTALYLPELPEGTEVLLNDEKCELNVGEPTLVELEDCGAGGEEDLIAHIALRFPDDQKDFRAKFPIVLVGLLQETEE